MSQQPLHQDQIEFHPGQLNALLARQKAAYTAEPMPSAEARLARLKALRGALLEYKDALTEALSQDFGHRANYDSLFSDILPTLNIIDYNSKRLKKWMKPSRRHAGLLLAPAKVTVEYQPLGVVGIIVPWNFPVNLAFSPLATALAAGNRAMIKMSEFTPHTNAVVRKLLASCFDEAEVAVVEGEAEVAAAFSALPFDHIVFTGSTTVGRHVMRAAAANLTPVTLELGGKSPAIVGPDIDITEAVERLIFGKCLNAGQICVAPDYVLLPRDKQDAFIQAYQAKFQRLYPQGVHSDDYSSVINQRQYQRLIGVLQDAEAKGAVAFPASEHPRDDEQHRLATHLLAHVDDDMTVMQEEIFGPILPLVPYDSIDEAIAYVQQRPRPLALYLFSHDADLQRRVTRETHSGGVALNDAVFHVAADDAPFGGIGPAGMGHYHGHEGFLTLSKAKTVLKRGRRFNTATLIHPPFGGLIQRLMLKFFLR